MKIMKPSKITKKTNRKINGSTNNINRETELESPSSPPPAPKKRVDMISWGPKRNIPNKIEGQTEGKVCIDITVAICTLEDLNRASPPQYNPNTKTPFSKIPKLK